jgi:DNA-binding MarR family transcriptional regulator
MAGKADRDDAGSSEARAGDEDIALFKQAGLTREIAFALRLAQLAVFEDLAKRIRPLRLTLSEFGALRMIQGQPALNQQQIGDALRIKKSNLATLIGKLEKSGLVTRAIAAEDRRAYALRLTPKGEDHLRQAEQQCDAHAQALSKLLTVEEREAMLNALERIAGLGRSE